MEFTRTQVHDFGVALNEATIVGVEVDADHRRLSVTLAVLALPDDDGPPPEDPRVRLVLGPVGRLAVSLRRGDWDDAEAGVDSVSLEELPAVVASFEQQPVYGWSFLDVPEEDDFAKWSDRLSLDWRTEPGGSTHTLDLFQESGPGPARHLDLRCWFDDLHIFGPDGGEIALDDFNSPGVRWWDAMYAGDPRTTDQGIVPLAPEEDAT